MDLKVIYWADVIAGAVRAAEDEGVIVTVTRIPTPGRPLAMRETIPHTESRAKR